MMTKAQPSTVASWGSRLLALLPLLIGTEAYALKVQQLTPLEMLEKAQLIVAVQVTPGTSPWTAAVVEVLKSPNGKQVPPRIRFAAFSRTEQDTPQFVAGAKHLLFLSEDSSGIFQCLSYGKQAVWPKTQIEWPYDKSHVSNFEDAWSAFHEMQLVLSEVNDSVSDKLLAGALSRGNPLLFSIASEFLSTRSKERFPQSHATLAGASQPNADLSLEVGFPKVDPLKPAAAAQTMGNLPPSVQPPAPKKEPEPKPSSTPIEEPPSSTPWSIIVVLILAAVGLLWLLLKRRS